MRCLLRRVAPNRFSALCLELDFKVVSGSKVSAFRELVRAICAEAKNDIAVHSTLPFRGAKPAGAELSREFKKARQMAIGFGGDHCWDVRFGDDDDSEASAEAQVTHAAKKGAAKQLARQTVRLPLPKRKKGAS